MPRRRASRNEISKLEMAFAFSTCRSPTAIRMSPFPRRSFPVKAGTRIAVSSHRRPSVWASAAVTTDSASELSDFELELDLMEREKLDAVDLVVAGAGPSGLAVGSRVAKAGFKVCIVDPCPLSLWPNNYGVWVDEFEAMGLDDCFEKVWSCAEVFLDNHKGPKKLPRPYARVDRPKLKRKLLTACKESGVYFRRARVESVDAVSEMHQVVCSDGAPLKTRLVLDATGHSRKLIHYDRKFNPAFQGAYGYVATVESHPFDDDTMLFMDWRDDYAQEDPELLERVSALPTFLYAMPFSDTEIFLEETSLVARPIAPFDDLKERLEKRLEHLGIKVLEKKEEEYCSIPMGGVLPQNPQSVLGIGGTAGMVHPSTGYMISRMLGAAPGLADMIIEQLHQNNDWSLEVAKGVSRNLWKGLWPMERIRQREFYCFGMAVLLQLNLQETRDFFRAFFALSERDWHGFLSSRLSLTDLIRFGWNLFLESGNSTRQTVVRNGAPYLPSLISGLSPTFFKT